MSRREAVAAGAMAVSALALGACGSGTSGAPAPSGHEHSGDAEVIDGALDIEHRAVAAYTAAAARLTGADAALAARVLAHEQVHVQTLGGLLRQFGVVPPPAQGSYGLRLPAGRSRLLAYLAAIENDAIAYYVDAMPKLSGIFRHAVIGVVGSEAEHLAVLRGALGLSETPGAFAWGQP